jgi:hypothetical protein
MTEELVRRHTQAAYDGLGRRRSKNVGGTVTNYLLDGAEEVAEYSGSNTLLRRYVTGPGIDDRIGLSGRFLQNRS